MFIDQPKPKSVSETSFLKSTVKRQDNRLYSLVCHFVWGQFWRKVDTSRLQKTKLTAFDKSLISLRAVLVTYLMKKAQLLARFQKISHYEAKLCTG